MNKKRNGMRVFILMLLAALLLAAGAEGGVIFGIGPDEAYTELTDAFDFCEYERAKQILIDNPELLENSYEDAARYATYLEALDYLSAGAFYEASQLFESLKDFRDSLTMAYYSAGRNAEKNRDFESAEAFYRECGTYSDANKRMLDCGKKKVQALVDKANALYVTGVSEKKISDLEAAYEIYVSLGETGAVQAAKCLEEISKVSRKIEYDKAVADYETAERDENTQRIRELKSYFESLGNYEDSKAYANRAGTYLENLTRVLTASASYVTSDSLTVKITDTASGSNAYEVACAVVNAPTETVYTVKGNLLEISGLFCSTEYAFRVTAKDNSEITCEFTQKTKPVELFEENGFTVSRCYLLGLKRSYLNNRTFEEIWAKPPRGKLERYDDFNFTPEDTYLHLQQTVYPYLISYKADAPFGEKVSIQWVLRTKNSGVYASEVREEVEIAQSGSLHIFLEDIMDAMYTETGAWPHDSMTIELYINGKLASQGFVIARQN